MTSITFNQIIIDAIGIITSPLAGAIAVPFALFSSLYKKIQEVYYNSQVGNQRKPFEEYNAGFTEKDIQWLKNERERLTVEQDKERWFSVAKAAARAIIPILGYFWLKNSKNALIPFETNHRKISWCQWHIDLLEGRIQKDSLTYRLGWNLPN